MQYLYADGDHRNFMDTESFDQIVLDASTVGDNARFIRENDVVDLLTYEDEPIDIELPPAVQLTVTETDPGLKGDTASGAGSDPATLETGLVVSVPLFINIGDPLKVDTRSGVHRASQLGERLRNSRSALSAGARCRSRARAGGRHESGSGDRARSDARSPCAAFAAQGQRCRWRQLEHGGTSHRRQRDAP